MNSTNSTKMGEVVSGMRVVTPMVFAETGLPNTSLATLLVYVIKQV